MKSILGMILVIGGLAIGFYVGGYVCLYKGIVQVINQIRAPIMETSVLAWGIVRILCCTIAGGLSAIVMIIPGRVLIGK